jgi:hypothetical protein
MAMPTYESEYEEELEGEWEAELEDELESEGEFEDEGEFEGEYEFEDEGEFESELSPIRKVYPDAMMEHLGALAAEAETEDEAVERFLPLIGMAASKLLPLAAKAIGPLAKRALPRMVKAVTRLAPRLTRGIGKIARGLHRRPAGRRLLRTVPTIARRTVHSIARQAAHGRPVTPRMAVRTLARQTRRVLGSPRVRGQALRRHHHMDRRFHRQIGRGVVQPHYGPAAGGAAAPGAVPAYGAGPGAATARPGRTAAGPAYRRTAGGGACTCPTCGATPPAQMAAPQPAAPAYCRCCGQVLR